MRMKKLTLDSGKLSLYDGKVTFDNGKLTIKSKRLTKEILHWTLKNQYSKMEEKTMIN